MTKILVIEDETSIRENILELLKAEGYNALAAENGQIGLQLATEQLPDLIISDARMPKLDGYGVLTALRSNAVTATIPFIFLTAKAAKTDLRQGMELGADDYLAKPFTRGELLRAIATRLEKQAAVNRQSQQQLNNLRTNITLTLPHELHTPLNGILCGSQLLIDEANDLEPQEILEIAGDIRTSAERLSKLVHNFLLYAQLELIGTDPEQIEALRQNSRTDSAKNAIIDAATQKAKQAGREMDLVLDLQDAAVSISQKKLQKIVEELVDNACKFSYPKSKIHVASKYENSTFVLFITDYGKGMTAEQIATMGAYMRFERKLSSQQGPGLGLLIAKHLIELHGGELEVDSIPQEKTIVRVALPIAN